MPIDSKIINEITRYGTNVILESISDLQNNQYTHFNYIYDASNNQGFILEIKFKKYRQCGNNFYISIYNAGNINNNDTVIKSEFNNIKNGVQSSRKILTLGFKIDNELLKILNDNIDKTNDINSLYSHWMSILSTTIIKSLISISNNKLEIQYKYSPANKKKYSTINLSGLENLRKNSYFEHYDEEYNGINNQLHIRTEDITSQDYVDIDQIIHSCFLATNKIYNLILNTVEKNKVSMKYAIRNMQKFESYWTKSLLNTQFQNEGSKNKIFIPIANKMINIVSNLNNTVDKINKLADESIQFIDKHSTNFNNDEDEIKNKAIIVSRQKALIFARNLYSECLHKINEQINKIDDKMKMFNSDNKIRTSEFTKKCDSIINTCIYEKIYLTTVLHNKEEEQQKISNYVDKILEKEISHIQKDQLQSIEELENIILIIISEMNDKIKTIFDVIIDNPNQITNTKKYITNFMHMVRSYSNNNLKYENMFHNVRNMSQISYKINNFLNNQFGINFEGSDVKNNLYMQESIEKHSKLFRNSKSDYTNDPANDSMSKLFEILLKDENNKKDTSDKQIVIQNGKFNIMIMNKLYNTDEIYDEMKQNDSFVKKEDLTSKSSDYENIFVSKIRDIIYTASNKTNDLYKALFGL